MYAKQKITELGNCIELVSMDPHFHNISVGLFKKGNILTIFSFSKIESIEERIKVIREKQMNSICLTLAAYKSSNQT